MSQKRLVSKKDLKQVLGIPYSPQHIARLEAAGKFPKRVRLGQCRVAWLLSEVEQWITCQRHFESDPGWLISAC